MRALLKDHFDSLSRVPQIKASTLAVIAELDKIIPPPHSYNLVSAFPNTQITSQLIKGADHNNLSAFPDYYAHIHSFLNQN